MQNNQQLKSEKGKKLNWQNGKWHHEKISNKGINEVQIPVHVFEAIRHLEQSPAFARLSAWMGGIYFMHIYRTMCLIGSGKRGSNSTEWYRGGLSKSIAIIINKVKTGNAKLRKYIDKDQVNYVIGTQNTDWKQGNSHGINAGLLTREDKTIRNRRMGT